MPNEYQKITKSLLLQLARKSPAEIQKYVDTVLPQFFIRHLPTGTASYGVQLSRTQTKSLGDVRSWAKPEDARDAAYDLLKRFRAGVPVDQLTVAPSAKPKPAAVAGLTLAQMFGLRADLTRAGVAIPGFGRYATIRDAVTRRTVDGQLGYILDRFVKFVGESKPLAAVTDDDVRAYLDDAARPITWTGNRILGASVERYLILIRGAFRYAIEKKQLAGPNPCVRIKVEKNRAELDQSKKDRWLLPHEEKQLRDVLAARDREGFASGVRGHLRRRSGRYITHATPLLLLMLNTGGRPKALFNLRWFHFEDLPFPRVRFEGRFNKKNQTYYVPLNREARDVIAAWKPDGAKSNDLVFPAMNGGVLKSIADVWAIVRSLADIDDVRIYDLRHTFASKLVQRSISLYVVSKLMGDKSQRMTERYAHLAPDSGRDAVELLNMPVPIARTLSPAQAVEILNQPNQPNQQTEVA